LAEAQARTEESLRELSAAEARTDERFARTDERLAELSAAGARTDDRLAELSAAQARTETQMASLSTHMARLADEFGEIKGWAWEWRYRLHAPAYFGRILHRIQVLSTEQLIPMLDDAVAGGQLTEDEADEIERADLICRGRSREASAPAYLVVEISAGVGPSDVERAARRAALLARLGTRTLPAVAGQWINAEAGQTARRLGVWQITDGIAAAPSQQT
jgi:uncharacterized coiled-coil protein SlyX